MTNIFEESKWIANDGDATGYVHSLIDLEEVSSDSRDQDDPDGLVLGNSDDGTDSLQRISHFHNTDVTHTSDEVAGILAKLMYRLSGDNPMPVRNISSNTWMTNEMAIPIVVSQMIAGTDQLRKTITLYVPAGAPGNIYISPFSSVPNGCSGAYLLVAGGPSLTLTTGTSIYAMAATVQSILEVSIERYRDEHLQNE